MSAPLTRTLAILRAALDEICLDPEVCRRAIYLGGEVPWDTCEENSCGGKNNGMLWANLKALNPVQGGSDQPGCEAYNWTAGIGIVRCVDKGASTGGIPTAEAIEADAALQVRDADTIFAALACCANPLSPLRDVSLASWAPLSNSGGCAGGLWTVRGRLDVCC